MSDARSYAMCLYFWSSVVVGRLHSGAKDVPLQQTERLSLGGNQFLVLETYGPRDPKQFFATT